MKFKCPNCGYHAMVQYCQKNETELHRATDVFLLNNVIWQGGFVSYLYRAECIECRRKWGPASDLYELRNIMKLDGALI